MRSRLHVDGLNAGGKMSIVGARQVSRISGWCRTGSAVTTVLVITLATGCASGPPRTARLALEETTIVVGAVPAVDTAGLYIAQQRGYFASEGLRVKIVPIVSSELAISRQLAGVYDITLGGYVSYIQADAEQNADLRIIAEGSVMGPGEQGLLTMPRSRITAISGLKGAAIALNVVNNVGKILVGSALEEAGLRLSAVKFVPIPFQAMPSALEDHKVDAAWMPEPFLSATEESLGTSDISDLDFGAVASFPLVGYAVTGAWERRNPNTEAAFLRALEEGQEQADTDRTAVEEAMVAFIGVSRMTAAVMALPQYPVGRVDQVRIQRVADAMYAFGMLKQPFSVNQIAS
jgi:NitT/TauT family transport system substrate-binding protein